jgi:hypothetical protein
MRSIGTRMIKKKMDRTAKPLAARVYLAKIDELFIRRMEIVTDMCFTQGSDTHNYSVIPSENSQLIKPSDEIPPSSDVTSEKDTEGENGDRVH